MLPYKIVRKETTDIMAHVLDNGDIEVHMPFEATDQDAAAIVARYLPKLEEQIKMRLKAIEVKTNVNYSFRPMLFGERYPMIKRAGDACEFNGDDKCFYVIPGLRQYQLRNFLKDVYTQIGNSFFSKQLKLWSERMGVKYKSFQISPHASPFGFCLEKGEAIALSWTLAMTDKKFVETAVIHELAHIKYDDHYSEEFIKLVKEFCPAYDEVMERKKEYEIMLRADGWIKFGGKANV